MLEMTTAFRISEDKNEEKAFFCALDRILAKSDCFIFDTDDLILDDDIDDIFRGCIEDSIL